MDQATYKQVPPLVSGTVRLAKVTDIPFMLEVSGACYPDINPAEHIPWMLFCLQNPDRLVLIGQRSFGVGQFFYRYGVQAQGAMEMLASRPGRPALEPFHILRQMVLWAKQRGAKKPFLLGSDTDVDFTPFARRLGATEATHKQFMISME